MTWTLHSRNPRTSLSASPREIADEGGTLSASYSDAARLDSFGHKMLTGCGEVLESFVRDKFGVKVRSIEVKCQPALQRHDGI